MFYYFIQKNILRNAPVL